MSVTAAITLALALGAPHPWLEAPFGAEPAALAEAAARLTPPKDAEIDVLREEKEVVFDAEGRRTWRFRLVYVARSKAAADAWSKVSFSYAPATEARPEIRARVVSPAGQARWLDAASVVDGVLDQSGARIYGDARLVHAPLPGVEVGAVVEEEILVRETAPFFAAGSAVMVNVGRALPVRSLRVRVEAPSALPLRVEPWGLPAPRQATQGSRRTFTLDLEDLEPAPEVEPGTPPAQARPRQLALSTGASWRAIAAAYAGRTERQLAGAELEATARGLVAPGDSPAVAAQKVLDWIGGQTRYTGLAFGESGLIPARPAETLARGYGDCKDLSLLAVGLLRASGRKAQLALLRTAPDELDPGQIGMGMFDHAVVRVEGTPPIWLDPAGDAPAGLLGPASQGRLALLVDRSTSGLVRTPEATPSYNRITQVRHLELAEAGWTAASEELRYAGLPAVEVRRFFAGLSPADAEKSARERLFVADGASVERHVTPGAAGEEVRLRVATPQSRWATTGEDTAEAVISPHQVFRYLPDSVRTAPVERGAADQPPRPRRSPLRLQLPHLVELRYEVVPAPGFRAMALPEVAGFTVGPASFLAELTTEASGQVVVRYRFESGRELSPAEVDRLWREVAERTATDGPRLRFERTSAALLKEGNGRAALDELRRLVALHPKEADHHNRLALALLTLGMGEAARTEARRAVALEPGQEWAQRVLGLVLTHDELSRPYGAGADLAGAEQALRRARAIDPRSSKARGLLAQVLLRAPGGARVGPGARLEEALSELVVVRDDLENHDFDEDYLEALLMAGRLREALAAAADVPAGPRRNAVLVAAAMGEGMERFGREVRALEPHERGPAGQAAFVVLIRCRQYQVISAFVGALRSQGALDGQAGQLEAFERIRRLETLELDRKDPASLPGLLFKGVVAPDLQASLPPLFRRGEPFGPAEELELEAILAGMADREMEGVSPTAAVEVVLSILQTRVEGDGPPWRIRADLKVGKQQGESPLVIYAIREDGLPRIAAVNPSPAQAGQVAWRLAKAGDAAGARRVLDWARERLDPAAPGAPSPAGVVAALWPTAGQAGPDDVLRTAAALAAFVSDRPPRRPDLGLEPLRQQATGPARLALTYAALVDTSPAEAARVLALADELMAAGPELADAVWWRRAHALRRLGRAEEAREAAQERLRARPGDLVATRVLVDLALRASDWAALRKQQATLLQQKAATPSDWNNSAWNLLFAGEPVAAEALETARGAVNRSRTPDDSRLHTLATVEAWSGRPPADVMATLLRAVQARSGRIAPEDWLVVGRIAEAYGLGEAAEAAYRRVPRPGPDEITSSGELAARRLRTLGRPAD